MMTSLVICHADMPRSLACFLPLRLVWVRHVTNMNESCHKHEWVTSYAKAKTCFRFWLLRLVWVSQCSHINESWHTHGRVMAHSWMCHGTLTNKSSHLHPSYLSLRLVWVSPVTHTNESCQGHSFASDFYVWYEWVMIHTSGRRHSDVLVAMEQWFQSTESSGKFAQGWRQYYVEVRLGRWVKKYHDYYHRDISFTQWECLLGCTDENVSARGYNGYTARDAWHSSIVFSCIKYLVISDTGAPLLLNHIRDIDNSTKIQQPFFAHCTCFR